MGNSKKSLSFTILTLSLVTVMAGAAVSPALGQIKAFYADVNPVLIQMILSLPALFIMITNLTFTKISKHINSKGIAILGLVLYVMGGVCGGLFSNIYMLLVTRVLVGIGTGLIMPLSTGLLAYYFSSEKQGELMGYSSAMNNIGGIIGMSLSGFLSSLNWRYSFLVYLIGLLVMLFVVLFLPKAKMGNGESSINMSDLKSRRLIFIGMFLTQVIFYLYITNFAVIGSIEGMIPASQTGLVMSAQTVGALLLSLVFGRIIKSMGSKVRILGAVLFGVSYFFLSIGSGYVMNVIALIVNGAGFGILVPYFNMVAVKNTDKEKSTGIMSVMSAAQYSGQFLSPLILSFIVTVTNVKILRFPYWFGLGLSIVLLFVIIGYNSKKGSRP